MRFKKKYKWSERESHFLYLQIVKRRAETLKDLFKLETPFSNFMRKTSSAIKSDFCLFEVAHSGIQRAMNQEDGTTSPSNSKQSKGDS